MLKIGLTGGIGCGKSTVGHIFTQLGVKIIDADTISHQLVLPGNAAFLDIVEYFGQDVLLENGQLNRPFLKSLIFKNPDAKKQLETILHPKIFKEIEQQLDNITDRYCIISIPLLFETNAQKLVDRILVVDCDEQTQIARVQQRDHLAIHTIKAIIASQVNADYRRTCANDIIENSFNHDTLAQQVKKLHNFYLSLSY
jgi:dephospho-CoA kinase